MKMTPVFEDNIFAVIIKGSLGLLALLTASGCAVFSMSTGMSILTGGAIALINFLWLRNVIQRLLTLLPGKPVFYVQSRFFLRIILTGFVLYAVITSGWCSIVPLLLGLSIIVANIVALSIYGALRAGG